MKLLERTPGLEFAGMTVNERLFVAGVMDAFGAAARARDRECMIGILCDVEVEDASTTVDAILAEPTRYGY